MVVVPSTVTLWTYRRIPYVLEDDFPYAYDVRTAMNKWESAAGVSFVLRRDEKNYLVVRQPPPGSSSSSAVGMRGGAQNIFINAGYKSLHELGHALGLMHEQVRSDRDQYVAVQWQSIANGQLNSNFQIRRDSQNLTAYDSASVMHYPAPAKGWQGMPSDEYVWTMRWKANGDKDLGPGSWSELSELDKSPEGLHHKYLTMPVPMGPETTNGFSKFRSAIQFPFSIEGRQFFYGRNLDTRDWSIQELLIGGKLGAETDHGIWNFAYHTQFTFTVRNQVFFCGQNLSGKNWFIQELLPGGKMGVETDHGQWSYAYAVQFPFTIRDQVFFYGQNMTQKNWFIQQLLHGGRMGEETDHGKWNNAYGVQFPHSIGGNQYFYGQNQDSKYWMIQRLLEGGKMGDELQGGFWQNAYNMQFPFTVGGSQYFYGLKITSGYFFIQKLIDV